MFSVAMKFDQISTGRRCGGFLPGLAPLFVQHTLPAELIKHLPVVRFVKIWRIGPTLVAMLRSELFG